MITRSSCFRAVWLTAVLLGGLARHPVAAQDGAAAGQFIPDHSPAVSLPGPNGAPGPGGVLGASGAPGPAVRAAPAGPLATKTLPAERDAFVSSDHAGTNYGNERFLSVGQRSGYGATRSLVWFETQDLARNQAVTKATLRLYLRRSGPSGDVERDVVVRRVTGSWGEDDVTWDRFPGSKDKRIDATGIGTRAGWYDWDVTEITQRWRWPSWQDWHYDNHGLYAQGYEAEGSYREFDSSETSSEPELRIEHVTDTRAPLATLNPDTVPLYTNTPDPGHPGVAKINLEWTGEDPEPATGIDYFRLEAQRNREAWVLVGDQLRTTSGSFLAENGKRFGFRVVAVDMAGNVEPESPAEVQTLVDLSPPVATILPLPEYERGPFMLSWTGHDEPTGPDIFSSGIASYYVAYRINQGGWANLWSDVTETSRLFEPQNGFAYEFQVMAVDMAGNLEPQGAAEAHTLADGLPPVVAFGPVAGIDQPTFTVTWQGGDPGNSGVVSYDIQWRRDLEPWRDWVVGTQQTGLAFSGEFSHVYGFRGRARDKAGNEGSYPSRPQLSVGVIDRGLLEYTKFLPLMGQRLPGAAGD